jgi:hypothetical protein
MHGDQPDEELMTMSKVAHQGCALQFPDAFLLEVCRAGCEKDMSCEPACQCMLEKLRAPGQWPRAVVALEDYASLKEISAEAQELLGGAWDSCAGER